MGIEGIQRLNTYLARIPDAVAPARFVAPVRDAMIEGHREGTLAGTDGAGLPLAPLRPATIARRDGTGPPTIPHNERSRMLRLYAVDAVVTDRKATLRGHWDAVPFAKYLLDRWPLDGLRPDTVRSIRHAITEIIARNLRRV